MYLTYAEYQTMGGALSETAFNDFEYEAETFVDWVTFNRLHGEEEIPERVKQCVFHLINIAKTKQEAFSVGDDGTGTATGAVASQSNDGVSISYNVISASEAFKLADKEMDLTVRRYLNELRNSAGKKLTYRGIYPDE